MNKITNFFISVYYILKSRKFMKPIIVWFYCFFDGNNKKILDALEKGQMPPERQFIEDIKRINLKDYITIYDFGFDKFCKKHHINTENTVIVFKKELQVVKE